MVPQLLRGINEQLTAPRVHLGQKQALDLRNAFIGLGIDLANERVAVSELLRTKQTAEHAGLKRLHTYSVLNEINTGVPHEELFAFFGS